MAAVELAVFDLEAHAAQAVCEDAVGVGEGVGVAARHEDAGARAVAVNQVRGQPCGVFIAAHKLGEVAKSRLQEGAAEEEDVVV